MVIHEFYKNFMQKVVFSFLAYEGKRYLDIRVWEDKGGYQGQSWTATQQGLRVPVANIEGLRKGIDKALSHVFCSGSEKGDSENV